jgi:hypothetical protein
MIIFGLILFILGLVFGIGLLETIGVVLMILGVVLWVLGGIGHPVGGRRYWW